MHISANIFSIISSNQQNQSKTKIEKNVYKLMQLINVIIIPIHPLIMTVIGKYIIGSRIKRSC